MFVCIVFLSALATASADSATESYKNQFCTDPRTMDKYEAYTEWADAYSCSRHRCQPGGRNLAIYTVGCKRVEAPESAIECEEVVEDTNMQFPFCCTRLRCLVVVRGEVWTRVLGQPWETLPAAPWSHMYKMKKPPPSSNAFASKTAGQGPIYELQSEPENPHDKMLRSSKNQATVAPDCDEPVPRAAVPSPDIVIALATNNEEKEHTKTKNIRHKRVKKPSKMFEDDIDKEHNEVDFEDAAVSEKNPEASDEKSYVVTPKILAKSSWTEVPNQWTESDPSVDIEIRRPPEEKEKPALQALVDAIGSRMRDIESVVQRMSEKVHGAEQASEERRPEPIAPRKHHKVEAKEPKEPRQPKKPNADSENYKRFSVKNRSKYLHKTEATTELPLFVEDSNLNGYFSDASNSLVRRSNPPKEPATYMAPVDTRRKMRTETSDERDKKRKKHSHKKRRKGKGHKKHRGKEDKRKHINRLSSLELDKNIVSLEDSELTL